MNTLLALTLVLIGFVLLVALAVRMILGRIHGTFLDLLRGQIEPEPRDLDPAVTRKPGRETVPVTVHVDTSHPIGEISGAYLSFGLDLAQVVGGKWWNPAADRTEGRSGTVHVPVFDFDRPELDTLVSALAPAIFRIGGSEGDKAYYDMQTPPGTTASIPAGYESVLTRQQWDAAHAFVERNGLEMFFTLNVGPGTRRQDGSWDSSNTESLLTYTAQQGYDVAAWELGNELNASWTVHSLSAQMPPRRYHADLVTARALVNRITPGTLLAGQSSAFFPVLGEPLNGLFRYMPDFLKLSGDLVDIVSWHYYPQQSRRAPGASRRAFPSRMLAPDNLDEAAYWADQVQAWRDTYAPGRPLWLGETGNAQVGGEPGVSDVYLGSLWWLDQLGLLARHGHKVVVRHTLVGSDYGMLELDTTGGAYALSPRPDYWASLLWRRLMGTQVYGVTTEGVANGKLRVYAHAMAGNGDGVTVLALNLDHERSMMLSLPAFAGRACEVHSVSAPDIFGKAVLLNGVPLALKADGSLPDMEGNRHDCVPVPMVTLPPLGYAFLSV